MFYAAIETNPGEVLNILLPNGRIGGKALLAFLTGVSTYCSNLEADPGVSAWFDGLEAFTEAKVCSLCQPLLQSFYSGDWDYSEDEFEWFLLPTKDHTVTEDKFNETVRQVRHKWVDIQLLFKNVKDLTSALSGASLQVTWWYEPEATVLDFQALTQTLALAIERGAEQVRIKFS